MESPVGASVQLAVVLGVCGSSAGDGGGGLCRSFERLVMREDGFLTAEEMVMLRLWVVPLAAREMEMVALVGLLLLWGCVT